MREPRPGSVSEPAAAEMIDEEIRLTLPYQSAHRQATVAEPLSFSGVGLHSGCTANLTIHPAPADTGIVFRQVDLGNFPIEAVSAHVANVSYATSLMKKGVLISTVEHVLSALYGLEIDNAIIDVDNMEVPILDGSAAPYVERILAAGIRTLAESRRVIRIVRPLEYVLGDKVMSVAPADELRVTYRIQFDHPLVSTQELSCRITPDYYARHLAPCRTFGFLKDIEHLQANGLIKGGSLQNAVVFSPEGILNPEGFRMPDECIRHKILDFLGDVALLGMPVLGEFYACKAGHGVHAALVKKILADPANYAVETLSEAVDHARRARSSLLTRCLVPAGQEAVS